MHDADEQVIDIRDVRAVARRAIQQWPLGGDLDDFESDAGLGATLALQSWDPAGGASLRTHAYTRMHWSCLDGVRERSWTTRGDLAKTTDVSDRDATHLAEVLHPAALRPTSLNLPAPTGGNAAFAPVAEVGDLIPDACSGRDYDAIDAATSVRVILRELRELGQGRYADVLEAYYLDEMTMLEIAGVLGVTESRVCQLLKKAHERARAVAVGDLREQQRWQCTKATRGWGRPIRELAAA